MNLKIILIICLSIFLVSCNSDISIDEVIYSNDEMNGNGNDEVDVLIHSYGIKKEINGSCLSRKDCLNDDLIIQKREQIKEPKQFDSNLYDGFIVIEKEKYDYISDFEIISNKNIDRKKTDYCLNQYSCPLIRDSLEYGYYACLNDICKPCNFHSDCKGEHNVCSINGMCIKQEYN